MKGGQKLAVRSDIRNVAIIAHVDHGKTTLVDALLWQAGAFSAHLEQEQTSDRVMDSGDLEREKGITILAKNTSVRYAGPSVNNFTDLDSVTINVIDTPGHADFGGEVERALSMVEGVLLLVDASEGPLPQTRFVLRKALESSLPVVLVVNKVDRPDARIAEVVEEAQDLLLALADDLAQEGYDVDLDEVLETPIVYTSAKLGLSSRTQPGDGELPDGDMEALFATVLEAIPGPSYSAEAPLQAQVTNLDASPFLGRLALLRVHNGTLHKGETVSWIRADGTAQNVRVTELLETKGLKRQPAESAGPGDIVAVAGIEDITIGDSLVDPQDPRPLSPIVVDDPAISMTIGINTSPLAGKEKGSKLTARAIRDRLDREMVGNVSLNVIATDKPDVWEVQARGELALAILVEQMRREGFELTVGKPQVVTKEVDGQLMEPMELLTVDIPEEYLGAVSQLLAARKGRMQSMVNHGSGWVRMEFTVPARGLIGFRSRFLTETRGTGISSAVYDGHQPWQGTIVGRPTGSLVADRAGEATTHAMVALQERASMVVEPGSEVYEGQVVGENSRPDDMDVNITRQKKQTNVRAASADNFEAVTPPKNFSLEEALEFASDDECVEVTPLAIRIRKVVLDGVQRARETARRKKNE